MNKPDTAEYHESRAACDCHENCVQMWIQEWTHGALDKETTGLPRRNCFQRRNLIDVRPTHRNGHRRPGRLKAAVSHLTLSSTI